MVSHFTLKPSHSIEAASPPHPYDEAYSALRGRGPLSMGDPTEEHDLTPDMVAFIPGGTRRALANTGKEGLKLKTMMSREMIAGVKMTVGRPPHLHGRCGRHLFSLIERSLALMSA